MEPTLLNDNQAEEDDEATKGSESVSSKPTIGTNPPGIRRDSVRLAPGEIRSNQGARDTREYEADGDTDSLEPPMEVELLDCERSPREEDPREQ